MAKKISISVTSDLATDQRVLRTATCLHEVGYKVTLIGRELPQSLSIENTPFKTIRFKLLFNKGALFYANYNIRLFFYLLFTSHDIVLANDLDTLLANYLASKIKKSVLVYDNHEYFTGVPELVQRKTVRGIWKGIEKYIFPKLKYVYTVNHSLKKRFEDEYNVNVAVIRNIPTLSEINTAIPPKIDLPKAKYTILYQGALNVDRGLEEAIQAMRYLSNEYVLVIAGDGDVRDQLHQLVKDNQLESKVHFTGKLRPDVLKTVTPHATLGLSIEKSTNINYTFCLPNKLFDYIHANIPVLASKLPEVSIIVDEYHIGNYITSHEPKHIADCIENMIADREQYELKKLNTMKAAKVLHWDNEKLELLYIFNSIEQNAK